MNEVRLIPLGPVLWGEAASGMTLVEIRAIYPHAESRTPTDRLADGAACELVIPHLEIAAHDFSVEFYFKDDKLGQVTIASNGGADVGTFRSIAVALRAKYGPELSYEEDDFGFSTADWIAQNGVNVGVVCYPGIGLLNIVFQTRLAADANKL